MHDADPDRDPDIVDQDPEPDEDPVTEVDQLTWVKGFHGGNTIPLALAAARNGDILAAGGVFFWVGRFDAYGTTIWERRFGYDEFLSDTNAASVVEAEDGTVFVGGYIQPQPGSGLDDHGWVGHLSADGVLLEQWFIDFIITRVQTLEDGDVLLGGWGIDPNAGGLAVRFSPIDGVRWARQFIDPSGDYMSIIGMVAGTGELILGGLSELGKANSDGEVLWAVGMDGDGECDSGGSAPARAVSTEDGGLFAMAICTHFFSTRLVTIRLDSVGNPLWSHMLGRRGDYKTERYSLLPSDGVFVPPDNLALMAVSDNPFPTGTWQWIGLVDDSTGDLVWQRRLWDRDSIAESYAGTVVGDRIIVSGLARSFDLGWTTLASLSSDGEVEGGCEWLEPDSQPEEANEGISSTPVDLTAIDVDLDLVPADLIEHVLPTDTDFACP